MAWRSVISALALLATLAIAPIVLAQHGPAAAAPPSAERERELLHLLYRDCGACHGMRLTGGLGPPLTRDALRGKSEAVLAATIIDGRPGTAMPPWRPFLSDNEAAWLAARLRHGDERAR
ncbi:MAG TPA: cytochrome c [Casimicrobiaceae bacterium]|jgi:cytochrome c55X